MIKPYPWGTHLLVAKDNKALDGKSYEDRVFSILFEHQQIWWRWWVGSYRSCSISVFVVSSYFLQGFHWPSPKKKVSDTQHHHWSPSWWWWTSLKPIVYLNRWTSRGLFWFSGEQWKKGPWLFRVYRGWNPTQWYGDDFINHYFWIPTTQPV